VSSLVLLVQSCPSLQLLHVTQGTGSLQLKSASITFKALKAGQSITVAGLTVRAKTRLGCHQLLVLLLQA
jgi:hypothetical protein